MFSLRPFSFRCTGAGFLLVFGLGLLPRGSDARVTNALETENFAFTRTFNPNPATVFVGGEPTGVAAADFDKDGDADLAVCRATADDVVLLLNEGIPDIVSFTQSTPVALQSPAGSTAKRALAADLDGDQDADLVVVVSPLFPSAEGNRLILLRNDSGALVHAGSLATGQGPSHVAAGDLDGDGDLDLAVTNMIDATIGLYENEGAGLFSPLAPVEVCTTPTPLRIADINQDQRNDLIVGCYGSGLIGVLLNNGSGGFLPTQLETDTPRGIAVADLDLNGRLDLFVTNYLDDTITLFENHGAAGFHPIVTSANPRPNDLVARSFDYDPDADILVYNEQPEYFTYYKNMIYPFGVAKLDPKTIETPSAVVFFTAAELSNDGVSSLSPADGLEIAYTDGLENVIVLEYIEYSVADALGEVMLRFSDTTSAMAVADLNEDGVLDVADGFVPYEIPD